jgi:hypothetical protein
MALFLNRILAKSAGRNKQPAAMHRPLSDQRRGDRLTRTTTGANPGRFDSPSPAIDYREV